jgi:hypothetical protein
VLTDASLCAADSGDERGDVDLIVGQHPQQMQAARGTQEREDFGGVIEDVTSRNFAACRLGHCCLRIVE